MARLHPARLSADNALQASVCSLPIRSTSTTKRHDRAGHLDQAKQKLFCS
jgi:hypothetical protein